MNDNDLFKIENRSQNSQNTDHSERTYNINHDSKNIRTKNNDIKPTSSLEKENFEVNNKINNRFEDDNQMNIKAPDSIQEPPEKSYREKEDEELQLNYQKITDDELSELNSAEDTKNDQEN